MKVKFRLTLICLFTFSVFFYSFQSTMAEQARDNIEVKFVHALMKQNEELARSYLANGVAIPKPKEKRQLISAYSIHPSPKKDLIVLVGYTKVEGELGGKAISLIWELTIKNDEITNIEVVY